MKRKITISESQIINAIKKVVSEARRNPETNIDESFADFYNRMVQKAPRENIFVSFREDTHVTDVNPKNGFRTPTGFYSYPLSSFNIPDNPTEIEFRRSFPFGNHREYINFFILKNHDGILTDKTDKSTLNGYVERIKKLYPNVVEVHKLCDSFIANTYTSDYIDEDPERKVYHRTHLFWLFLYDVAKAVQAGNIQTRINLICRKIGVNGFIDYGDKYIHRLEPMQAVFFKVKNLGKTFIYEKPKISGNTFKNAIQNKEYEIVQALTDDINLIKLFDKYSLTNKNGELITKQWFDYIGYFEDGFSRVRVKDRWNIINQNGELISNHWFDLVYSFQDGFAMVKINNKFNLIGENGKILSKQWFERVHYFDNGIAKVELNDKYNFINKKGELLCNQWFDRVGDFKEGVIRVWVKGKGWNFINQKCELISEQWFDGIDIDEFNEGVATVKLDSKYNFINKNGKILSKQWFDEGFYWKDGIARVQLNNKFYDLNLNNNSITEVE